MACMGPSKEYAYEEGQKAFCEILTLLKNEYHIHEPHIYPSTPDVGSSIMGHDLNQALAKRTPLNKAEWEDNMEKLKTLVQEIIWADHANGF